MLKNRGFSLIELMATIGVIGISAAAGIPMFSDFIENSRLRGAAETVFSDLQLARSEAIKVNSNIHLSVKNTDGNWCYGVITKTANCDCFSNACSSNTAKTKGVSLINDSAVHNGIHMSPNGAVYNAANAASSGEITLYIPTSDTAGTGKLNNASVKSNTSDFKSISIQISSLGHTSICSSTVPGYTSC